VPVDAVDEGAKSIVWEAGALEPFRPDWERAEEAVTRGLTDAAIALFSEMKDHRERLSNKTGSPRHPTKVLIRGLAGRKRYARKVEIERDLEALHKEKWLTVCSVTGDLEYHRGGLVERKPGFHGTPWSPKPQLD
jgi:hypothetical protein